MLGNPDSTGVLVMMRGETHTKRGGRRENKRKGRKEGEKVKKKKERKEKNLKRKELRKNCQFTRLT